ncbi:DUF5694 domain-containing protein [Halobacillus yeomjeoni]|uniref:DUF5694 domain-containing protein n=1 Tax=Halobacillus yeomjeoni TaxID=311194 RepID=UPI001CD74A9A|nr:DUF5694 domain-containing protein [Halobacillus yeomjeoni]MCA0984106.1 DUF5694 domain-containing protein [Halobacillus yeomjeoni]
MEIPEIMVVGTTHMAMNPNTVNQQQEEIKSLVESLSRFKPTKIAVEKSFLLQEELDRRYTEFQQGNLTPAYDEVEQIAFRLSALAKHTRVYPVDEVVDMSKPSLEEVFTWAKEHQPHLFKEILDVQATLKTMENDETLLETLKYINHPDYIKELQRVYMKLARVGDHQHQIGVQWLKQWHQRDLSIAANIARIAEPNDRILVLMGGDHIHLLTRFLEDSGDFSLTPALSYLKN